MAAVSARIAAAGGQRDPRVAPAGRHRLRLDDGLAIS
jgi:hypothetical protein